MKHSSSVNSARGDAIWREDLGQAMKANDIVKYSRPADEAEARLRFILLREPEKGRADIQLICDYRIKPVETVEVGEIEAAGER